MKVKKMMSETDDSRTYKRLKNNSVSSCHICSPHKGCNRMWDYERSWKEYRKTQWKTIDNPE